MSLELSLVGSVRVCRRHGGVSQRGTCRVLKIHWERDMAAA